MKTFNAVLIGLLIGTQALAGLPPTSLKGQSTSSSKTTTFNFQVPERQSTQISGTTSLIETGSTNKLSDPGFEGTGTSWTASGGTFTVNASNFGSGAQSGSWDSSAASQTLTSSSMGVTSNNNLASQNGAASCRFKCSAPPCTHVLEAHNGTNILASTSITSLATGFTRNSVNFPFPASGNVTLRVKSVAANEPTLFIDDCYGGLAEGFNAVMVNQVGEWIAYTPTFTGFGTPTAVEVYHRRVGDSEEVQGKFTSGTTTAVEARIGLPGTAVSSDTGKIPSIRLVGQFTMDTTVNHQATVLAEPSVAYVTLGGNATNTGLTKQVANTLLASTQKITFNFTVPIQGYSSEQAFRPDQVASSWSGFHSNDCGFTRTNAVYGDPAADATCTFTERTNSNFGTVTSYLSGADKLSGFVFTPVAAIKYYVCANVQGFGTATGNFYNLKLWDGTTTIAEAEETENTGTSVRSTRICGMVSAASIAPKTISIQTKISANTVTLASTNSPTIEWSIFAVNQSLPAPLLVNSVVSKYAGILGHEVWSNTSGTACTVNGVCASTFASGGISSVTRTATGSYTAAFTGYSLTPGCTIGGEMTVIDSATSTNMAYRTFNTAGTLTDVGYMNVICAGPR